jgi:hypothetical protein
MARLRYGHGRGSCDRSGGPFPGERRDGYFLGGVRVRLATGGDGAGPRSPGSTVNSRGNIQLRPIKRAPGMRRCEHRARTRCSVTPRIAAASEMLIDLIAMIDTIAMRYSVSRRSCQRDQRVGETSGSESIAGCDYLDGLPVARRPLSVRRCAMPGTILAGR